jgi:hypothetical protein
MCMDIPGTEVDSPTASPDERMAVSTAAARISATTAGGASVGPEFPRA